MNINTKFDIGDKVFAGRAEHVEERISCPRCRGTGLWKVTSHVGEFGSWTVTCQVCKDYRNWGNEKGRGTVKRFGRQATVTMLTIGSVQFDSKDEKQTRYMCNETGVGSGIIHYEKNLFATREEAKAHADQEVQNQLPEALKKDRDREERASWDEMHHATRPTRVQTEKREGARKWCAWIQEVYEVTNHQSEKAALKALAEALAEKL